MWSNQGGWSGSGWGRALAALATNLLSWSQDFTNSAWTKNNVAVTANAITAPDSTTTGSLWTFSSNPYPSIYRTVSVVPSTAYTLSFYAQAGTSNFIDVELRNSVGSVIDFEFTLTGGGTASVYGSAVGSPTGTITNVGGGWYRCKVTKTTDSNSVIVIIGQQASPDLALYMWGSQYEVGSSATTYNARTV